MTAGSPPVVRASLPGRAAAPAGSATTGAVGGLAAARPIEAELLDCLRCPVCRAALDRRGDDLRCVGCARSFPVVLGIPDLRLYEDPLIPLADDYRKGEVLLRAAERMSFAELVAFYWTLPTYPPTPADLIARFVHHVQSDDRRLATWEEHVGRGDRLLDVGCGAGVLVRAAHRRFREAVGVDVGFRWLVVARHGLLEAGITPRLVCACADHLPFADGTFDTVTSVALLEQLTHPGDALREFGRVQRSAGRTVVWTSNRFSAAPEPHVRVWGVGFLPRRWMPAYVRWRRGLAYTGKTLLSRFELARLARRAGYDRATYHLPGIAPADVQRAGPLERLGARAYERLRRVPWLRQPIVAVFPALLAVLTRSSSPARGRTEAAA
jgi:ubiquinone/menaquinone biosynthesis C-methylase UbiE/uncharacterized protein YbaR (Trm112 family)